MKKFLNVKVYCVLLLKCGETVYDPNYKEDQFETSDMDMTGRTMAASYLIDNGYHEQFAVNVVNSIADPQFCFDDGSKLTVESPSGKIVLTILSESEE